MARPKKEVVEKFVTVEKFNQLSESVGSLVDLMKQQMEDAKEAKIKVDALPVTPEALKIETDIKSAGPKKFITPVNPEWEQLAKDIINNSVPDAVERCEMEHLRSGGLIFTIVIKKEKSNATDDYLRMYKEDRRSREIGAEGIGGVEAWAKLIGANLKRGKSFISNS